MLRENLHANCIPNGLQIEKKNLEFSSAEKWMNNLEPMHAMKYYIVIQNYEALVHVIAWMILRNSSQIDRCQATQDSILCNPII